MESQTKLPVGFQPPPLREPILVTQLRKMQRQCASLSALERVSGGVGEFRYLDSRYGITKPLVRTGIGVNVAHLMEPRGIDDLRVPLVLGGLALLCEEAFEAPFGSVYSRHDPSTLNYCRAAFVGLVRDAYAELAVARVAKFMRRTENQVSAFRARHFELLEINAGYRTRFDRLAAAVVLEDSP